MHAIIFTGAENSAGLERVSGAYRIATILRREGWDVEVVDYFYYFTLDELKQLIDSRNQHYTVNWIGFSATWLSTWTEKIQRNVVDFVSYVKEKYPETNIITGGADPRLELDSSRDVYKNIDYIVSGFGEVAIVELLKYLYSNGPKLKWWPTRWGGKHVDANAHYAAWPTTELSVDYEERDFLTGKEALGIELSRGCRFACSFCNFPILGVKDDTTRDIINLEYEFRRNYDKWGVKNYQISDETFNDRDEKLIKIANVVKSLPFEPNFNAFIRADLLVSKPHHKELLATARIWSQFYGIETLNHETGKRIGKGMHPDKIKAGLLDVRDYFRRNLGPYRGSVSLIFGLPKETRESLMATMKWFQDNWTSESVIAFPLNINTMGHLSKIDKDYESYGYRKMDPLLRKQLAEERNAKEWDTDNFVIWENDQMNFFEAMDLTSYHYKTFLPNHCDGWKLMSLVPLCDTLEEAVALNEADSYRTIHETSGKSSAVEGFRPENVQSQEYLREKARAAKTDYVNRKLSW